MEAQGVEDRARAQHALMASKLASKVGQGIGRIGDNQDQRLGRRRNHFGNNISVDVRIGVEKLQPSGGVAAVRGTTGLFVDTRGDDHEHGVGKVRIVAGAKLHCRRERRAVLEVGYDTLCALLILVQHNDLARSSSHDEREKTSSPWRNPFFLSDGSDNGDSGSFEMDEAAEAKNKGLCYRCTSGSARAAKKVQKYTTKADFSALGECRLPAKSGSSGSD